MLICHSARKITINFLSTRAVNKFWNHDVKEQFVYQLVAKSNMWIIALQI
jgi:hypothetical protein